jgi:protein-tyrosine-phosphatase
VAQTGEAPAVLFACTMNAVRSPMAAAILNHLWGQGQAVASAGVRAGDSDPYAVAVMDELGIDISEHEPRTMRELENETYDLIVTLSPEAQHHAVELTRTMPADIEYWPTLDATAPGEEWDREEILQRYREVRDHLFKRIKSRFGQGGGPNV